jgi:hydrogenase maturation factor
MASPQEAPVEPPFDQLVATAEAVAAARPEVDLDLAREVFLEAATLLHNGLALDGLDEHDARAVVAGLCADLVAEDPGAAVRARSEATIAAPGDLHDPEAAAAAYAVSVGILRL